jgi:uncharacterized protein (DUF433 family)
MATELLARITQDAAVMGGRPCIRGMRVTVGTMVGLLAAGHSVEKVLELYHYCGKSDGEANRHGAKGAKKPGKWEGKMPGRHFLFPLGDLGAMAVIPPIRGNFPQ